MKKYLSTQELDQILTKEYLIRNALPNGHIPVGSIAKKIGCDSSTVKIRVIKFSLEIANKSELLKKKPIVFKNPEERNRNISKTLRGRIRSVEFKEKIRKTRGGFRLDNILIKEFLQKNYVEKRLSMFQISKIVGCSDRVVKKYLLNLGFHVRSYSETKKGQKYKKHKKHPPLTKEHLQKILIRSQATPNKFEQKCLNYLNQIYENKVRYVGNGSLIINGRSADAYLEETKTIFLFHGIYYHLKIKNLGVTEENKRAIEKLDSLPFSQAGYKVVIIWEDEIDGLIESDKIRGERCFG